MKMATIRAKYVIIGNSAGGIGAAEAIREVDKSAPIIIVSDEPYPAYSRPMISAYLSEKCSLERMLFRPPDFYKKNNIQTLPGRKAQGLNIRQHILKTADGSVVEWERLLLATGGTPIIPPTKGLEKKGVFTFTTLDDARSIDKFLTSFPKGKARAVVIGGGLIGLSVTEALVKRGVKVTVVEMKDRVLNTILDETGSILAAEALGSAGVNILTGSTVSEIAGGPSGVVNGVVLSDSKELPCEFVVVAIGVRPRTELAVAAGLKVNRGIVVDRHMESSAPDIFACGDVAETYDFIYGENRLTPIWPNAYMGGRIAGFNMAGIPAEYDGGTSMNSLKYFGLSIVSAGVVNSQDDTCEVFSQRHGDSYRKVVLKDGRVVGMIISGAIEKSGIIYSLMKERVNVEGFREALIADDFGLACLPEDMRRARLGRPDGPRVAEPVEAGAGR